MQYTNAHLMITDNSSRDLSVPCTGNEYDKRQRTGKYKCKG